MKIPLQTKTNDKDMENLSVNISSSGNHVYFWLASDKSFLSAEELLLYSVDKQPNHLCFYQHGNVKTSYSYSLYLRWLAWLLDKKGIPLYQETICKNQSCCFSAESRESSLNQIWYTPLTFCTSVWQEEGCWWCPGSLSMWRLGTDCGPV